VPIGDIFIRVFSTALTLFRSFAFHFRRLNWILLDLCWMFLDRATRKGWDRLLKKTIRNASRIIISCIAAARGKTTPSDRSSSCKFSCRRRKKSSQLFIVVLRALSVSSVRPGKFSRSHARGFKAEMLPKLQADGSTTPKQLLGYIQGFQGNAC
jgi:hypothetical protein